jgi:hypothetical protein
MLWRATIEPQRRSPRGDVAVDAVNTSGCLANSEKYHGPGRWCG